MSSTVARISLENCGVTPSSEWVEARTLRRGFSIIVWDDQFFRRPRRRYFTSGGYSWRAFALALANLSDDERVNPSEDAIPYVVVEGESGLVAEILRYAYASGELRSMPTFAQFLVDQTDDCLSDLEKAFGPELPEDVRAQLDEVASGIYQLGINPDLRAIGREATNGSKLDLTAIVTYLDALTDAKGREEIQRRVGLIAPFRDRIDSFVQKFDDQLIRGGGMTFPSKRQRIRRFLEEYVIANGVFPNGLIRIKSDSRLYSWDLGTIDFGITEAKRGRSRQKQ